jgi:hypothetical protein
LDIEQLQKAKKEEKQEIDGRSFFSMLVSDAVQRLPHIVFAQNIIYTNKQINKQINQYRLET